MKTDIEIAREAEPKTIDKIADKLGIGEEYLERYGKFKSKVDLSINDEKLKIVPKSILNWIGTTTSFRLILI